MAAERKLLMLKLGSVLFLLVLLLVVPLFVTDSYLLNVFVQTFYIATVSMAWSILGGLTGQNSLGHAAFMGLGAYLSSVLITKMALSPWVAALLAMGTTTIIAMVFFYPCFILRGPYFTLVSIAFGEAVRNVFINWDYVGKATGILLPFGPDSWEQFRFLSKVPYYYIGLLMLLTVYWLVFKIDRSKLGFALKTIREDEDVAASIGIYPVKYKVIAVGISAMITSFAGFFLAQYLRYIDPTMMAQMFSVEYVLPAIIGGIAFLSGPIIGAFLIVPLSELLRVYLSGILPGVNLILYAFVLIVMIRFQPRGLLGWYAASSLKPKVDSGIRRMLSLPPADENA